MKMWKKGAIVGALWGFISFFGYLLGNLGSFPGLSNKTFVSPLVDKLIFVPAIFAIYLLDSLRSILGLPRISSPTPYYQELTGFLEFYVLIEPWFWILSSILSGTLIGLIVGIAFEKFRETKTKTPQKEDSKSVSSGRTRNEVTREVG